MINRILLLLSLWLPISALAQYEFTEQKRLDCLPVEDQGRTGTCWSFSTASFLESELLRMGQSAVDLSEMYGVRLVYVDKARNYLLRQGKAQFSQGSLGHDLIHAVALGGIMPETVYPGTDKENGRHDHRQLERDLKELLDGYIESGAPPSNWREEVELILDTHLGPLPEGFRHDGKEYSPEQLAEQLGLEPADYVSFSSYTHHPFYRPFILEIPDNYSNGAFWNVPMDGLEQIVDAALEAGYTVVWDGDVSERGFSAAKGLAILPLDESREDRFKRPGPEITVTQELRQQTFESYATTDDHLMHLVGKATDQAGNAYYVIKNSWGDRTSFGGYLYMSRPYFRLKTVSILLHKEAVPSLWAQKCGWN